MRVLSASRVFVGLDLRPRAQAHGGNSSAISSATVTGFTCLVWSRIVDAVAAVAGVVGVEAGAAVGGVGVVGPLICGAGGWGVSLGPPPPGARQSMIWKCGRDFIPKSVFIG